MKKQDIVNLLKSKKPYQVNDIDHVVVAITTLRSAIPKEVVGRIIGGSEHDIIYLVDLSDEVCECLTTDDVNLLAECNVSYSETLQTLYIFS